MNSTLRSSRTQWSFNSRFRIYIIELEDKKKRRERKIILIILNSCLRTSNSKVGRNGLVNIVCVCVCMCACTHILSKCWKRGQASTSQKSIEVFQSMDANEPNKKNLFYWQLWFLQGSSSTKHTTVSPSLWYTWHIHTKLSSKYNQTFEKQE